ncbi:MAG: NAD(+)/NADH kinase [Oscillospiraceae bacterium]|nr:NAD(+)/NADH kinase [Oscillospiraceae bacterium]
MKVLLLPNFQKNECFQITLKVIDVIKKAGADIFALDYNKQNINDDHLTYLSPNQINSDIDFAIAIGGDGTIIKAANLLLEREIPLIGVNLGTLGFLAGIEKDEIELLSSILAGKFTIDERMTLEVSICRQNGTQQCFTSINDVVICKNAFSGIIDLDVYCSDVPTAHYRADGIIFSTPSGSTAYAMSAGGPIMHPDVKAISLTPICAHSLLSRPIILPEYEEITVKTNADSAKRKVFVVADGLNSADVAENDIIKICRYEKNIKFISANEKSFYSAVNKKLMER